MPLSTKRYVWGAGCRGEVTGARPWVWGDFSNCHVQLQVVLLLLPALRKLSFGWKDSMRRSLAFLRQVHWVSLPVVRTVGISGRSGLSLPWKVSCFLAGPVRVGASLWGKGGVSWEILGLGAIESGEQNRRRLDLPSDLSCCA